MGIGSEELRERPNKINKLLINMLPVNKTKILNIQPPASTLTNNNPKQNRMYKGKYINKRTYAILQSITSQYKFEIKYL